MGCGCVMMCECAVNRVQVEVLAQIVVGQITVDLATLLKPFRVPQSSTSHGVAAATAGNFTLC